jgi:hypothetical protein
MWRGCGKYTRALLSFTRAGRQKLNKKWCSNNCRGTKNRGDSMFWTRKTWRPTVFHLVFWSSIRRLVNSSSETQRLKARADTVRNTRPEVRQASNKLQNNVNSPLRFSPLSTKLFLPSRLIQRVPYSFKPWFFDTNTILRPVSKFVETQQLGVCILAHIDNLASLSLWMPFTRVGLRSTRLIWRNRVRRLRAPHELGDSSLIIF